VRDSIALLLLWQDITKRRVTERLRSLSDDLNEQTSVWLPGLLSMLEYWGRVRRDLLEILRKEKCQPRCDLVYKKSIPVSCSTKPLQVPTNNYQENPALPQVDPWLHASCQDFLQYGQCQKLASIKTFNTIPIPLSHCWTQVLDSTSGMDLPQNIPSRYLAITAKAQLSTALQAFRRPCFRPKSDTDV